MKYLIRYSVLVEAERQNFDLGNSLKGAQKVWICDATVTEFLAGEPIKDPGKAKRWREVLAVLTNSLQAFDARRLRAGRVVAFSRPH